MIENDLAKFANKQFGQNFLKDKSILQKIIESKPKDNLQVVEIGPGLGDLTKELLNSSKSVIAFEVDKRLCEHLQNTFYKHLKDGSFAIRCGDVLNSWESESLVDEPYHLVANLPYYIATNIILRALRDANCKSILVMVQKEVALKFSAKPQQREFAALSVLATSVGKASICFDVPPSAFVPQPKVVSAILKIEKDRSLKSEVFEDFLKIAFVQPRKKLFKNLSQKFDKEILNNLFAKFAIDVNSRPHELTTKNYIELFETIKEKHHE